MNKLLSRAMFLLARRDHSEYELRRKLATPPAFPSKPKRVKSSTLFDEQRNNVFSPDFASEDERNTNIIDESEIDAVIQYCYENNWLNDTKFATCFIRSYANKGYGPRRIQLELQKRGVNKDLISNALMEYEIDWYEFTHQALIKHFKPPFFSDWKSKSKIIHYLMHKGFHLDDINHVLDSLTD